VNRTFSRVLTGLAIAVVAGTLLNAASSSAGPGYTQPKPGSCHQLTARQANAKFVTASSVDCAKPHTSKTMIVKRFKADVDWSQPTWIGIDQACAKKTLRAIGGDKVRALSAFELTYLGPLAKDRAHGATWKRCDLILHGKNPGLAPLPEKLHLSLPLPDRLARCYLGPFSNLRPTACSKPHQYRGVAGFRAGGSKYPGAKGLERMAFRRCPDLVDTRSWIYEAPSSAARWRGGWRTIGCYERTRK
jgi:Septum formation